MAVASDPSAEPRGAVRDAWRLARGWARAEPWTVAWLVGAALALILLQLAVDWGIALWHRTTFDALEQRQAGAFGPQALAFAGLMTAMMLTSVGRLWTRQAIGFRWRRWLVLRLQGAMLEEGRHHRLAMEAAGTDNPDQRIGENTRWATAMAVDLALGLIYAVVLLVSFAGMLWHLSADFFLPVGGERLHIPGGLLWAALLYALGCAAVTWWLGRRLPAIHMDRNAAEANHRFALVRLRENSESIALIRGEADERRGLAGAYAMLEGAMLRLFRAERDLMWLGCCYMPIAAVVPLLLGAPQYLAGAISLGVLMQGAQAFQEVTRALTWLTETWPRLADWRCHVGRVVELEQALAAPAPVPGAMRREDRAPALALRDVALAAPCGRPLLRTGALTLQPGERLLIRGESGSGKSTLFRAIAGLWPWAEGEFRVPCRDATMFLPQRPYLPLGTLAAALAYPDAPDGFDPATLRRALLRCRLPHLVPRLGEAGRWDRVLSLGEQQRVAFARLILHRPRWIFMDEATSALDEANEAAMFALLAADLPEAAVLSIGHRPGLDRHHDRVFVLEAGVLALDAAGRGIAPPTGRRPALLSG
ncbi:ABC transporter ATP-binding protein/permease [Roseomonas sp. AR75]|uniref:ABC transporter ATP-binding protein/permease n=1 Tax=Roseomonas sp. AR75 TaxID=2562311 RepID=UPI0010C0A7C1|nr:ABC transporter ATP-binding protein/permease [Roseomonas sp. AR75]